MEQLLHYVWKHRLFPMGGLATTDGKPVEVIDSGLHNTGSGHDFLNAKVKIGGQLWVGNVEIHDKASDWFAHGHDRDSAYDNVVLHVVGASDAAVCDTGGRPIAQAVLGVPRRVADNYRELLATERFPPCYRVVPRLRPLTVRAWLAALQAERLEEKTGAIARRAAAHQGDWEGALFVTLARNFGFGINGDAFEEWARSFTLNTAGRHRDNLFQIEALFMGQAGLLDPGALPPRYREAAMADSEFVRLGREYAFLAHKYGLHPICHRMWRFLRLRPQNFPHIRIAQLARLYFDRRLSLSALVECDTAEGVAALLQTRATPYWQTHYAFGVESAPSAKRLTAQSAALVVINTAVPVLFAYGRHTMNERLCDRALALLDGMKAENNAIVRAWRDCGLEARTAGDSQALIQLRRAYCDRRECLRCRIGYEYLKGL